MKLVSLFKQDKDKQIIQLLRPLSWHDFGKSFESFIE